MSFFEPEKKTRSLNEEKKHIWTKPPFFYSIWFHVIFFAGFSATKNWWSENDPFFVGKSITTSPKSQQLRPIDFVKNKFLNLHLTWGVWPFFFRENRSTKRRLALRVFLFSWMYIWVFICLILCHVVFLFFPENGCIFHIVSRFYFRYFVLGVPGYKRDGWFRDDCLYWRYSLIMEAGHPIDKGLAPQTFPPFEKIADVRKV